MLIREGKVDRAEGLSLKEFASDFYNSPGWKQTRSAYKKSVGGLCEVCIREGRYRAGEIVHHKIPLTPDNITDPDITLSWKNLQLVCRECHARIHDRKKRRYKIDDMGRVIT